MREIFDTLSETGEKSDFETANAKLTEYWKPQENKRYETYQFHHLHQGDEGSLDTFHTSSVGESGFTDVDSDIEQQIIVVGMVVCY